METYVRLLDGRPLMGGLALKLLRLLGRNRRIGIHKLGFCAYFRCLPCLARICLLIFAALLKWQELQDAAAALACLGPALRLAPSHPLLSRAAAWFTAQAESQGGSTRGSECTGVPSAGAQCQDKDGSSRGLSEKQGISGRETMTRGQGPALSTARQGAVPSDGGKRQAEAEAAEAAGTSRRGAGHADRGGGADLGEAGRRVFEGPLRGAYYEAGPVRDMTDAADWTDLSGGG